MTAVRRRPRERLPWEHQRQFISSWAAPRERTPLDRVRIASANYDDARRLLEIQVREARAQGYSLREIANEAGMSYEKVRRICK